MGKNCKNSKNSKNSKNNKNNKKKKECRWCFWRCVQTWILVFHFNPLWNTALCIAHIVYDILNVHVVCVLLSNSVAAGTVCTSAWLYDVENKHDGKIQRQNHQRRCTIVIYMYDCVCVYDIVWKCFYCVFVWHCVVSLVYETNTPPPPPYIFSIVVYKWCTAWVLQVLVQPKEFSDRCYQLLSLHCLPIDQPSV